MTITIEDDKTIEGAPYAVINSGLRFLTRDILEAIDLVKKIMEAESEN